MPVGTTDEKLLLSYLFMLEIDSVAMASFKSCTGLSQEVQVIENPVSNEKGAQLVQKVRGRVQGGEFTLSRPMTDSLDLYKWMKDVVDGKHSEYRRNGSLVIYDSEAAEVGRWNFTNAWPSRWSMSEVNATADEPIAEEITIQYETLDRTK